MNTIFDQLFNVSDITTSVGLISVSFAMVSSLLLSLIMCEVYRITHKGSTFNRQFLFTMIIMSVATSVIMLIIGTNIARAFSLVGALSVIRFRTPVKDSKDIAFIFVAMVIGMGCGTSFYLPTVAFTLFISVVIILFYKFDYGARSEVTRLLKIEAEDTLDDERLLEELKNHFGEFKLINQLHMDSTERSKMSVFLVVPKSDQSLILTKSITDSLKDSFPITAITLSAHLETLQ